MKVLCVTSCYIDRYYEEGQEYEYNGPKSPHLAPVDSEPEEEPAPKKASRKPANLNPANQGA